MTLIEQATSSLSRPQALCGTRRVFLTIWCVLALVKLVLALALPLFGDEAFYWLEGQYPAWSYSDLPPVTAWLAAIGSVAIPGEFGVRAIFLALGLAVPWQLIAMTRRWYGDDVAWRAGVLAMLIPLASILGVLALPDVPLAAVSLLAVDALALALRRGAWRDWLSFGAAMAMGLLVHYRFLILVAMIGGVLIAHPSGRRALRACKLWVAVAVAALGLVPLLVFNLEHDLAGLRFQLVDRHPWAWQSDGWLQLVEQALVASPVVFGLFGWTVWRTFRQRPVFWPEDVVVPMAAGVWLAFFVLGFFADNERFRWHWSLPAYLLLVPALAARWPQLKRWIASLAMAVAASISLLALSYFAAAAMPERGWLAGKQFPANFAGWREAALWMDGVPSASKERWVVDNFMLAAALRFYRDTPGDASILVLNDTLNIRHGRAAQLSIWGIDEAALAADPKPSGWLIAEETARRFSDRWAWYQEVCARFVGLELDDALTLHNGRKRFVRWRYDAYDPQPSCQHPAAIPPLGWVDAPARVEQGALLEVSGWAVQPELGIDVIEVLLDGEEMAKTTRTTEVGWVEQCWGEVADPAGSRVGFRAQLSTERLDPGPHRLSLRVRRGDGRTWILHDQLIQVLDP